MINKISLNCFRRIRLFNAILHQKRSLRMWDRPWPYPPNFQDYMKGLDLREDRDHVFLPTLETFLNKKRQVDNPYEYEDIGVELKNSTSENAREERRRRRMQRHAKSINLLELADFSPEEKPIDYDQIYYDWCMSNEGLKSTVLLANHYGIYKDLFSSPNQKPIHRRVTMRDKPATDIPQTQLRDFIPRDEMVYYQDYLIDNWFPGAKRVKDPTPLTVKYFHPIVPLYIEFEVPECEIIDDEVNNPNCVPKKREANPSSYISSPVFRGNLISPQYATKKPNIVINNNFFKNDSTASVNEKKYPNIIKSGIKLLNDENAYYSLMLLNLDTQFGDEKPVCHWMLNNMKNNSNSLEFDETFKYLPIYGFRGFGYHRYVFLLYRHDNPITMAKSEGFNLKERIFDPLKFVQEGATPVGLSWFQTKFDHSCKNIFHKILDMKMPTYEWIQPPERKFIQVKYPRGAPFNLYLDHFRDPKEMNKEVILERLKNVDPLNYKDTFKPELVPQTVHLPDESLPSWYLSTEYKKKSRVGRFRYLRPPSATLPLNNNADLDARRGPNRPEYAMQYPDGKRRPIALRDTWWVKPFSEHPSAYIVHTEVDECMADYQKTVHGFENKKEKK